MADFVVIPEIYIKEEPLSEAERRMVNESSDPLESEDDEGAYETPGQIHTQHGDAGFDTPEGEKETEQCDSTTAETTQLPGHKMLKEEDESKTDNGRISSPSIFEPEVNIEAVDEELQCNVANNNAKKLKVSSEVEKKHQCPLCGKFFLTSSAMNGHVAKQHGTTLGLKFTCHVCGAPGSSRASLKRHLIRTHKIKNVDHPELLTKKCVHCSDGFSSHLLLYEHIRSSHEDKLPQYHNCNWCPALMRAKASLIRHIRRAHPGKEDPFLASEKCDICQETFNSRFLLQRHLKNRHPTGPPQTSLDGQSTDLNPNVARREQRRKKKRYTVECSFCLKKFGSKPRLQYHVEVVHTNPPIKIYTCRMCGLTFPTAKQNNRHYRKVHRPERQKVHCGKCNITFKTPEECSEHRAIHPNTCDVCQKQFLRRDSLREHLLIHSAPRHQCPHCSKRFTQRSNLKRHIRVHTGEKPYRCSFCSRCFSDKSACNSHVRVHTGYERSVCSVCGASFSKKQRLNYHMRMHTGEGLLYCPLCMRPSTNSYSLRKHIESHEQPLTKALTSIGFRPLLVSDPNFVMRALHALTHATLQTISRHENIPNSFKEETSPEVLHGVTSPESDHPTPQSPELECKPDALDDADMDAGSDAQTIKTSPPPSPPSDCTSDNYPNTDAFEPFNLTKFLQGLLEKESLKVRMDRKHRRDRRLRRNSLRSTNQRSSACVMAEERESDEEELPSTVGDDLVKQCLEIIMKDEPHSDDDNEMHSDDDDDDDDSFRSENEAITTQVLIKTEPPDDSLPYESESVETSFPGTPECDPEHPAPGIPKIKISRVTKTDPDSNEDLFIAEIVKKQ